MGSQVVRYWLCSLLAAGLCDAVRAQVAWPYHWAPVRLCMLVATEQTRAGRADGKPEIAAGVLFHCDLFNASTREGVACYRIPSLVTAPNGDLVAAVDERVPRCSDLHRNRDINVVLADAKVRARLADLGTTAFLGSSAELGKFVAEETDKWGAVVKSSGAKPD